MINALLDAGADPNDRYAIGDTALDIASAHGYEDVVDLLLSRGGDPNATFGKPGRNALLQAVSGGYLRIVRLLLSAGADPNGSSEVGATALMAAAGSPSAVERKGSGKVDLEIMRLLFDAGAQVDAVTIKGQTALMFGCDDAACSLDKVSFDERFAAVRLLVEEGKPQMNLKNSEGKTAFDYTSVCDFPELQEYLRKRGAKPGKELSVNSGKAGRR